jgi:SH3-like domain-containing protein
VKKLLAVFGCVLLFDYQAMAAEEDRKKQGSGLPLPRFASLKVDKVNMRMGPSKNHAIMWELRRIGLPVEIVEESDNWRQIRISDGTSGWVFHSLLSGRRTVQIKPWAKGGITTPLLKYSDPDSHPNATLEPGVVAGVKSCDGTWCNLSMGDMEGWIRQTDLWGVYTDEKLE